MAVVFVTGVWKVPGSRVSWDTENTQVLFTFPLLCLTNAEIASSLVHKCWLLIIPKSIVMDLTVIRNTDISSWPLPVDLLVYRLVASGFDFEHIISKYCSNFRSVFTTFFVSIVPSHTLIRLQSFISYPANFLRKSISISFIRPNCFFSYQQSCSLKWKQLYKLHYTLLVILVLGILQRNIILNCDRML